ncbi:hypothetical protein [Streptomyces tardus]|uniref:hypothetical protein n=1 Tax=Streptomyces tardus TaxID=2780544 RepID=UPI0027E45B69|nr:hypothetical protein [Streptomyces tardus]
MTDIRGSGEEPGTRQRPRFDRVQESYGFACLHCGHTWEQTYEIEHHLDRDNKPFFYYYTGEERVPSPLSTLTCLNCGEHTVRITGTARISAVRSAFPHSGGGAPRARRRR